jgi:EAL domain-containing protein (putative c-di-GMP-specific phosphodiesterase class I)
VAEARLPDSTVEALASAARAALTQPGIIDAHFQPIADVSRGTVAGYEALARFAGPPQASPDRWFAAAHEAGFGPELEARAVRNALLAREALPVNTFLTINLSPEAAVSDPVQELLARLDDLRGVIFEITEQQAVEDYAALRQALAPLRERGALLAVDDAGAGFASLQHITQLRPNLVKVDRALVAGIDRDATRAAVVETLGIFASRLDAWLLAEGVETAGELSRLAALAVPLGQGYYLGRPAPVMRDLAHAARDLVAQLAVARHAGGEVAALAEPAPALRGPVSDADLARLVAERPSRPEVVVVDEFDRPVELISIDEPAPRRRAPMKTTPGDAAVDVVRRALARSECERFDPIAACDDLGRLVGLVTIEGLVEHLARTVEDSR